MSITPIEAGDPDSRSADNVAGNIDMLRALFPDAFTEDGIDFDAGDGFRCSSAAA